MKVAWPLRALIAVARVLLPRRIFLALVAPVVAEAEGRGLRVALRVFVAVLEQLGRYALLVPRDWLAEAGFQVRSRLQAIVTPAPLSPASAREVSMSLGDRMLSTDNPAARRRAIAGSAAIALHAAVIAVAVVWSFVKVEELPVPPSLPIVLTIEAPKPPPAPKPLRAQEPRRPQRVSQAGHVAPAVSRAVVSEAPAQSQTVTSEATAPCTSNCGGPGDGDGDGGDDGIQDGTAPAPEPPLRFIPPTWKQPERVSGHDPAYTAEAKAAHLDGSVKLKVCFDKQGAVTDAKVLQGMPMGMTEAAVRTVQTWRYRPYLVGGQAIRGCVLTTFNFTLR